jgi:cold shock CspA family protein
MVGFLPHKKDFVQILSAANLLLAAKSVAPLRDEFPELCESVRKEAAKCLEQACNEVVRQGWTRAKVREVVGAVSILQDELAIRFLCERFSHFSFVSHDAILEGLASCDKAVLHQILLDEDLFEKLVTSPKRDYLVELWFRAMEELNSVAEIEQAIKLCSRANSALALQVACGFNPEIALREINPFSLHLGEKSLSNVFSLVDAEKHARFLRQQFSEEHNPLRLAAAIRLASIQDEIVLQFLIEKCVSGERSSERGTAFAALRNFGNERISQAVFRLLSEESITLHKLVACPLIGYVKLDREILKASGAVRDYLAQLLNSGADQQTKLALAQIIKLGLGELFRGELTELVRRYRFQNVNFDMKQHMRVYEALKGQRFRGVILLMDTARGIGSIWCEETQQLYFLRQNEVWDNTPVTLHDAVEFEVATGRKPKKDFEVVKVAKLPERRIEGIVEKVVPDRSFGLINVTSEKNPIFFHFDNVSAEHLNRLIPKTRVNFVLVPRLKDPQSVQAVRVRLQ